ncbi:MAG TPA: DUF4282 domain-containing protein [Aeromonadales bacterium]|nr:DUF4282 domain-containing protein [Aeromonadales bacterium]
MKDILFFDKMLTPKIITFVYWLGLIAVVITSLREMFSDYGSFLNGIGMLIGGLIAVRIWSELLIVLFKINDNLQDIADKK